MIKCIQKTNPIHSSSLNHLVNKKLTSSCNRFQLTCSIGGRGEYFPSSTPSSNFLKIDRSRVPLYNKNGAELSSKEITLSNLNVI